jgi:hypothetical protein
MLSLEADEQSLYLKSMGMGWNDGGRDKHLSQKGAAEFYWGLFITGQC